MNTTAAARPGRRISSIPLVVVLGLATVVGCTPIEPTTPAATKEKPRCRLLRNGVPLKPAAGRLEPGDNGIRVLLIPLAADDKDNKPISLLLLGDRPGTFELKGEDGRVVRPGRYRVVVSVGREGGKDELAGKYSLGNSKIEVEVKEDEDLVIELANYQ